MSLSGAGADDPVDAELRADALDVARDVVHWRLALERWNAVAAAVAALRDALGAGDRDDVRDIVTELELLGPVRATSIGAASAVPAPDQIRDGVYMLVHALEGGLDAGPAGPSEHDD